MCLHGLWGFGLFLLACTSSAWAQDGTWPLSVKIKENKGISIVREDAGRSEFVYRSEHYEFVSDVRLSKNVVGKLSELFEATFTALSALPLGHTLKVPGPEGQTHFRTRLFLSDASYRAAGGPPLSSGVFIGRTGDVLIPLNSLGVKSVGRRVIVDPAVDDNANQTLVHELVHQLTAMDQGGAHMWYREGLAEYLASCPYKEGGFSFENRASAIKAFTKSAKTIQCAPMSEFLTGSRIAFYGTNTSITRGNGVNYNTALLLTDYLFQTDAGASVRHYLDAIQKGAEADDALSLILNGRSIDALQSDFDEFWQKAGLIPVTTNSQFRGENGKNMDLNPQ